MSVMLMIIAALSWILFAVTAGLYFVGNKLNVRESQSLAFYSLAALLSDEFRTANRTGFEMVIQEAHSKNVTVEKITYGLMNAVTVNARRYNDNPSGDFSALALVMDIVKKSA